MKMNLATSQSRFAEVPRLRAMAEAMIGYYVDEDNVISVCQLAFFLQSQKLKDACVTFIVTHGVRVEVRPEWEDLAVEVQDEIRSKIGVARAMAGQSAGK